MYMEIPAYLLCTSVYCVVFLLLWHTEVIFCTDYGANLEFQKDMSSRVIYS